MPAKKVTPKASRSSATKKAKKPANARTAKKRSQKIMKI